MEIIEGNKLIAEFMGETPKEYKDMGIWIKEYSIRANYNEDWNLLMPVVEKIEKDVSKEPYYGFTVRISDLYCSIVCHEKYCQDGVIYQTPYGFKPNSKIEATWLAVIEFIKYYNPLLNQRTNDKPSVATGDDSSNADDNKTY
jgi:hypothetical protein